MNTTHLKSLLIPTFIFVGTAILSSCHNSKPKPATDAELAVATDNDSTIYGVCGDGSTMNRLEIITDHGDTTAFILDPDADILKGGLLPGDRMAVVKGEDLDGEPTAKIAINLATLQGEWIGIDRRFALSEDGNVIPKSENERMTWRKWKIHNGLLVLGKDTFAVEGIGPDSLYIGNHKGIYGYARAINRQSRGEKQETAGTQKDNKEVKE